MRHRSFRYLGPALGPALRSGLLFAVLLSACSGPGGTERIDNIEVSRTARAYPANCTADIPYPYATALTVTTADVKTVVPQSAGVGKI